MECQKGFMGDVAPENDLDGWTGFQRRGHTPGNGNNVSKSTEQDSHCRAGESWRSLEQYSSPPSVIHSLPLRVWSLPPSWAHSQWGKIRQTRLDTGCRGQWGLGGRRVPFSWSHPGRLPGRGGILVDPQNLKYSNRRRFQMNNAVQP